MALAAAACRPESGLVPDSDLEAAHTDAPDTDPGDTDGDEPVDTDPVDTGELRGDGAAPCREGEIRVSDAERLYSEDPAQTVLLMHEAFDAIAVASSGGQPALWADAGTAPGTTEGEYADYEGLYLLTYDDWDAPTIPDVAPRVVGVPEGPSEGYTLGLRAMGLTVADVDPGEAAWIV